MNLDKRKRFLENQIKLLTSKYNHHWKERLDIQRELRALEGELSLLKKELK